MPSTLAYCYRSGQIGFTQAKLPRGAIMIVRGDRELMERVKVNARLAYDNETWLVPGIPEADDDNAAADALQRFIDRVNSKRTT